MDRLVPDLESRGHVIWRDVSDLAGGDTWRAGISEAIRRSDVVIVVVSPDSARSRNVAKELSVAEERDKRIIPVLHRPAELRGAIQLHLTDLQHVDFTTGYDAGLRALLVALDGAPVPGAPRRAASAVGTSHPRRRRLGLVAGAGVAAAAALVIVAVVVSTEPGGATPVRPRRRRPRRRPLRLCRPRQRAKVAHAIRTLGTQEVAVASLVGAPSGARLRWHVQLRPREPRRRVDRDGMGRGAGGRRRRSVGRGDLRPASAHRRDLDVAWLAARGGMLVRAQPTPARRPRQLRRTAPTVAGPQRGGQGRPRAGGCRHVVAAVRHPLQLRRERLRRTGGRARPDPSASTHGERRPRRRRDGGPASSSSGVRSLAVTLARAARPGSTRCRCRRRHRAVVPGPDPARLDEPRAEREQERLDHRRVVAGRPHRAVARLGRRPAPAGPGCLQP